MYNNNKLTHKIVIIVFCFYDEKLKLTVFFAYYIRQILEVFKYSMNFKIYYVLIYYCKTLYVNDTNK